ncbi:MAG: glycosyltransferase [Chitinivibrionia bacterium]|nr:glycosyltransferase [Chitinivibrionia bacterium]
MRVLHVIDSGGMYGAETMLLGLASEQRALGVEPVIGSIGRNGQPEKPIESEARARGIPVVRFTAFNGPDIRAAAAIIGYAKRRSIDLIHTHGYKGNILLGFIPRRMRTVPMLRTLHGWTNTRCFSKGRIYQILDVLSLRFTESVVAVSRGMLERKPLKGASHLAVIVIENGIAPPARKECAQDASDDIAAFRRSGSFIMGSIGRLSREKGYRHLLSALELLVAGGADAKLVVIGDGPERREIERAAGKLGLRERILLPGYKADAKRYIRHFDVYVLSSLTEGLPIAILEAMHAGTPVVATAVGGVPDLLLNGEAGLLVPPADPRALADAVKKLMQDRGLAGELSRRAQEVVRSKYSLEAMARSYLEAYRDVIARNSR